MKNLTLKQLNLFEDCTPPATQIKQGTEFKLFIDGASRNNPGPAGAGIYLKNNEKVILERGYFLGHKTNNQAEYLALIIGILHAKKHLDSVRDSLFIFSDSELLIKQFKGEYRVKNPDLKKLHRGAQLLLQDLSYAMCHVMREYNQDADRLANKGIDKKIHLSHDMVVLLQEHEIHI